MGIIFATIAASMAALCNLLLRMSITAGGNSKAFMAIQVSMTFMVMVLLNPVRMQAYDVHLPAVFMGCIGGLILGFFFWSLGKTMENGPAGLSISVLNATSIMPALIMGFLFGAAFGHDITLFHSIGFLLVTLGVFWAGWAREGKKGSQTWLIFAGLMFICHTLFLTFLQWWALILDTSLPLSRFIPYHFTQADANWFMPAIFGVAAVFQIGFYLSERRNLPTPKELTFGLLGGLCNGICSYFLILAPQVAAPWENAVIFPVFSVGVIILCNLWASLKYSEQVNWKACAVCILGVVIGTLSIAG
jgi:hypothetical protein